MTLLSAKPPESETAVNATPMSTVQTSKARNYDPSRPKAARAGIAAAKVLGIALVAYFLLGPLIMLAVGAFRTSPLAADAQWTLSGFETVLNDERIWSALSTSLIYSGLVTTISLFAATAFAVLNTRTKVRFRGLITPVMITLAVIPNLFYVLAWSMLGSSEGGMLSLFLQPIGLPDAMDHFTTMGWPGLIVVTAIKVTGLAYLLLLGPVRNLDPSAEDAAVMCGVPRLAAFRQITIPSLTPALSATGALLFVAGLETFEIPAMLGRPVGIEPLSVFIYSYLDSDLEPNYAAATALSLVFVAIVAILLVAQARLTRRKDFSTVGGKSRQHSHLPLGRLTENLCSAALVVFAIIALVLPLVQILLGSFQSYFGGYENWTLANYSDALNNRRMRDAIVSTLLIAVVGGAVSAVLSFTLAYVIHRNRGTSLSLLFKVASWVPAAAPGIVLSISLLWMYLYTPGLRSLFGTPWMMMLALIVATLPVAARAIEGSVVQIRDELEEASRIAGASKGKSILDVTVRLCLPSILAGWLLVGLMMSGRLDIPLMLQTTGNQTITTLTYAMYGRGEIAESAAVYCLYLAFLAVIVLVLAAAYAAYRRRLRLRTTMYQKIGQ